MTTSAEGSGQVGDSSSNVAERDRSGYDGDARNQLSEALLASLRLTCTGREATPQTATADSDDKGLNPMLWNQLPDALLDKIFARLSFRVLFQTRMLSKKWATRIANCRGFQAEVSALSSRWESYCPLFWSWSCEWLIGYNRFVNRWQKLFPISYFPGISKVRWLASGGAGSLLCFHQGGWGGGDLYLHVTNPLLRIWDKLPATNTPSRPMLDIVHVARIGSSDYQVIVVTQDDRTSVVDEMFPFDSPKSNLCAEIYIPSIDYHRWTTDALGPLVSRGMRKVTSAYFDGTLYFVLATSGFRSFKNLTLFAYEVGRGRWITIAHPFEAEDDVCQCGVVVCGSRVLLVLMQSRDRPVRGFKIGESVYGPSYIPKSSIQILEIIPESYVITPVCRGPAQNIAEAEIVEGIASDNECVYLQAYGQGIVVACDVQKQLWSCIPIDSGPLPSHSRPDISSRWFGPNFRWTSVTFQPGLNPFAMGHGVSVNLTGDNKSNEI